jgi:hypothetical protein
LTLLLLAGTPAFAVSVKDYEAKSAHDQVAVMAEYLDRMTGDLHARDPQLSKNIHDFFWVVPAGEKFTEGELRLQAELIALDRAAKEGKVDLTKIPIEGVILKVVKDKFSPPR